MGEREHLEQPAIDDLLDHLLGGDRAERVEDRLAPGRHLLRLRPGQEAELLATDSEQRAKHDDLAMLAALKNRLEARAQCKGTLPGAGPAA